MNTTVPFQRYFILRLIIPAALILLSTGQDASAAALIQHLIFTPPLEAADTSSGNHIDKVFRHEIFSADGLGIGDIAGAHLDLLHFGNLNEGPTQEIWSLVDSQSSVLATLNRSSAAPLWEEWIWPLPEIGFNPQTGAFFADVRISERTSFNGEKFEIRESKLTLDFADRKKTTVTPEPATALLLFPLLLGKIIGNFRIRRQK